MSRAALPDTGANTLGELQVAGLLLIVGIGMAVIGRRRFGRRQS